MTLEDFTPYVIVLEFLIIGYLGWVGYDMHRIRKRTLDKTLEYLDLLKADSERFHRVYDRYIKHMENETK